MEKTQINKREFGMSRIVGFEESAEQEILEYFKAQFEKDQRNPLEQKHTNEMDALISQVNEKMKEFMARYDVESLDISGRNIHVIDKSKLNPQQLANLRERYEKTLGIYLPDKQQIGVLKNYALNNKLSFVRILIHEMIHMNAFASAQKIKEGGLELTKENQTVHLDIRRMGFQIDSVKTGKKLFHNINEAITEELSIRFGHSYLSQFQDLKQEYGERKKAIQKMAENSGKSEEELESMISHLEYGNWKVVKETIHRGYSYYNQRKELNWLINDLYEKNKKEFQSPEDVFTLFAKAALNGRLLPIARLIEKTYGKGSFRKIGKETAKKD